MNGFVFSFKNVSGRIARFVLIEIYNSLVEVAADGLFQ